MNFKDFTNSRSKTGRTTRLIEEALRHAREGRSVYLIAKQVNEIRKMIDESMPNSGIKVEKFIPNEFSWLRMCSLGAHPNCIWLIDHLIIESDEKFRLMFDALTKFDENETYIDKLGRELKLAKKANERLREQLREMIKTGNTNRV